MKFSVQLRQAEITELSKDGANHATKAKTEPGKNDDYPIYFLTANFKLFMKLFKVIASYFFNFIIDTLLMRKIDFSFSKLSHRLQGKYYNSLRNTCVFSLFHVTSS